MKTFNDLEFGPHPTGLGGKIAQMDLGKPVMEPEVDGSSTQVNGKIAEMPKGGEI